MTQLPKPDVSVDLTEDVCPYTIVKSKLALESMAEGQVLSVLVADAESAQALPLNLAYDGHEVLAVNSRPPQGDPEIIEGPPHRSEVIVRKRGG